MLDFLSISTRSPKAGVIEIYPSFQVTRTKDLMIRGGDFYAIWVEDKGLWSTDEHDAVDLIDRELRKFAEANRDNFNCHVRVLYLRDAETGMIDTWHKYCQKQHRDTFHMLDEELIFSNTETSKEDYASKKLPYPLSKGSIAAYDRLISTLYTPEERHKLEWAIGSIVSGDSKHIQKFMVLYGSAGTGKSTILNIVQKLFDGYYSVFDAKALGSSSNSFALEAFKSNPLVAIQHDGDLSRIEDNTRLNSLVSHELMTVNEKFKSTYASRFKCFLFMGTNKPVRITDAKSGLIRRLIDVSPSGEKIPVEEYMKLVKQIDFELGAIAQHCLDVYLENPNYYDTYIPVTMLGASNDFYNFVLDSYHIFKKEDGTTLKAAWEMYKNYIEDAKVGYPMSKRAFKEELRNYFREYSERVNLEDGSRVRSYYSGFRTDKFEGEYIVEQKPEQKSWLTFNSTKSIFDDVCSGEFAQYSSTNGTPIKPWDSVKTKLKDLDTTKLHFVKVPVNHIVIDFDIPDEKGGKSFERNLEAASKWPPTYAELSKSGAGIHLHYIYTGDPMKLSRIYEEHVEVKVFNGNSSLRRMVSKCNDIPISTISSGLPLRGEKMVNFDAIKSEKSLRALIIRNLNKEIHPGTKPSVDFIYKILEDAYASGMHYDVTDMRNAVMVFAAGSTHQADYCLKLVPAMKFKSEEPSDYVPAEKDELVFYDVEVFPNLFLVNWKVRGKDKPVIRMINPKPSDIEELLKYKLIGFNNRRYDNHMLYARLIGYTNEQLFDLSKRIVEGSANCFFGEAYNLSYTDVYDFAAKKQGLKKWEIELGIHHKELGLPWDQPVPEERWLEVAEYCDNDVIATEAVFDHLQADFLARKILAEVAGMSVNDTTNSLTTRIIFEGNRKPQSDFNYRDMGNDQQGVITEKGFDEFTVFDLDNRPIFPGYKYGFGRDILSPIDSRYKACENQPISFYRDELVGEGGYVYAEPGIYWNVALLDIASMHPSSVIAEELFGPYYTKRFQEIKDARVAIKHGDFEKAKTMLNGALAKFLTDESAASDLAQALKIAINSVYGLTAAKFDNPFRDPRNVDNIVAKRGALFMVNLKHEVQKRGFTVAHIKTDSIKIPNATPEIIQFVSEYGKMYGYDFEHEATYDRMCLVNDAVYIARYKDAKECAKLYGYVPDKNKKKEGKWDATGAQFQVPYVYKTLFSKEDICFSDLCETKSVTSALYLDMNENLPDATAWEKELSKIENADGVKFGAEQRAEELHNLINEAHNYIFVGKVGRFCPMKDGANGGVLLRETKNKKTGQKGYASAGGAKGYRWLESEMVEELGKEDLINRDYYNEMVNTAIDTISKYGDFESFVDISNVPPWDIADDPWHDDRNFNVR